jgi:phosphomannomutase
MLKFGTGGWRAIIGEEFTRDNVTLLAQAIAIYLKEQQKGIDENELVIGYDRRFLSQKAAIWISEILAANGLTVHLINDVAPTPLIMYTIGILQLTYGLAVTASHNSYDYNGIKFFTEGGKDASLETTDRLETILSEIVRSDVKEMDYGEGLKNGRVKSIDPFNRYIDDILEYINVDKIKERRLRVLVDPMHGVARTCIQTVLVSARCNMDVINDRHDPLFGGKLPSPSNQTLNKLKDMVVERNYDLGIATDGDADRLGIIDENGTFIHPNDILVLLYYYLLEYKGLKGGVVRNIATTHLLDRIATDHGETCYEVPVGFKHISKGMEEMQAIIGGESSGGLTINGRIRGKDGIFAAALIVEMISITGKSLAEMLGEIHDRYGKPCMEERNYTFTREKMAELRDQLFLRRELPPYTRKVNRVSYEDGMKIYFENDGWIITRFSGTEPLLRIYAEMETAEQANQTISQMEEFLQLS